MAIGAKKPINLQPILVVVLLALAGLYLFNTFFIKAEEGGFSFNPQTGTGYITTVFQILIMGVIVIGMWGLAKRFGTQGMGKKDVMTLIFVALLAWFLWENVLVNLWEGLPTFNAIAAKTAMKMGMVP